MQKTGFSIKNAKKCKKNAKKTQKKRKKTRKNSGENFRKKSRKMEKSVESVQFLGCSCTHRQRGVDAPFFRGAPYYYYMTLPPPFFGRKSHFFHSKSEMREPPKSEKIVKKQKKSIFFIFFILGSKTHFLTLFQKIPFSGTPHFGTPQNEVFFQTTRKAENQKSEKVTQPSNYQTSHILMLDQTSNGCAIAQRV